MQASMDTKSMENEPSFSNIRNVIVSELAAGEVRAQRALRALQHQEGRIFILENKLREKYNALQELQKSHSDLMEVHRYQAEVQELQKQLIKMQEIQYLTAVVRPKIDDEHDDKEPTTTTTTKQETFLQVDLQNDEFNAPKPSQQNVLFKSFTTGGRRHICTSNDSKKNERQEKSSATDNAILSESETSRIKFCSLKNRLGCMGNLLQYSSSKNFDESTEKDDARSRTNYFARSQEIGVLEDETRCRMRNGQMSTSKIDDDGKISVLKETLSLHRQSIEDLSSEVVHLRQEKLELLCQVQSLMEWKSKMEMGRVAAGETLPETCENAQGKGVLSTKEIDVIMPALGKSQESSYDDIALPLDRNQSKHVRLNLGIVRDSNTTNISKSDKNRGGDEEKISTKLESRAQRMWETACRFFTRQQAHFILTAPLPFDQEDESSAGE